MQETVWNSSNLQDRTLISQIKEGDQNAFETLALKYQHRLSVLIRWHAGAAADEDDLLQRLMCKVYFSLNSFEIDRPFYPWLRRIAINLCCDEKRRLRRKALTFSELDHAGIEAKHPVHAVNSNSNLARQEMNDMLQTVIGLLPDGYQEVINLHHLQQMPYEEIGAILNCSPRAARVKAFRARAALRRLLEGAFSAEENCSTSSSIVERLDACCRQILIKSSRPDRVNGGIKESPRAC